MVHVLSRYRLCQYRGDEWRARRLKMKTVMTWIQSRRSIPTSSYRPLPYSSHGKSMHWQDRHLWSSSFSRAPGGNNLLFLSRNKSGGICAITPCVRRSVYISINWVDSIGSLRKVKRYWQPLGLVSCAGPLCDEYLPVGFTSGGVSMLDSGHYSILA